MVINEMHHAETKTKTEVISNYMFSFDQFIKKTKSEMEKASETV